jgi:hypothetical protein
MALRKNAIGIRLVVLEQKSRFLLAGNKSDDEIRLVINRWL